MIHIAAHFNSRLSLLLLGAAVLLLALLLVSLPGEARTWYVDDDATPPGLGTEDSPFVNITQALAVAWDADSIYVFEGEYNESLVINKTLTLEGEWSPRTEITGQGAGPAVTVVAERVKISGFTIISQNQQPGNVGVLVSENELELRACIIRNNHQGVMLVEVEKSRLENCIFQDNIETGLMVTGDCPQTMVKHCYFTGNSVNNTGGELLDASGCWWEDDEGPSGVGDGKGVSVSANVDFSPWFESGSDSDEISDGYQPDLTVLNVDDNSPQYGSKGRIQEGIDMVQGVEKDRKLWVQPGIYNENIVIDKTLKIEATQHYPTDTTINGGGKGDVVRITADKVIMSWFTVTGSGKNWGDSGVELDGVSNCLLSIIYSQDNFYGISLLGGESNQVSICHPRYNHYGIRLWKSQDNMLYMPNASANKGGIFLYGSSNNAVYLGLIEDNEQNGIYLWEGSNNNSIGNLSITGNDHGVDVYHSSDNSIHYNNIITDNDVGIRFSLFSQNNTVENNSIENNQEADIQVFNNFGPAGEGLPDPGWKKNEEEDSSLMPIALVVLVALGVLVLYFKKDELLPKG